MDGYADGVCYNLGMTLVVFLLILSFLVFIHEVGHLVSALIFKVRVHEFGFGYPPRIKTLFKRWGIEFTLNWIPFGGFVRLAGEDREGQDEEQGGKKKEGKKVDEGMFHNKRKWQRLVILMAGAFMNFVFGVVAFSVIFTAVGIPESQGVVISEVQEGTPAAEAGLEKGDRLEGIVVQGESVGFENPDKFVRLVGGHQGEEVELSVLRGEEKFDVFVYVRKPEEVPADQGALGILISAVDVEFVHYPIWQMPFRGAWTGTLAAFDFGWLIVRSLGGMVGDLLTSGSVPQEVSGPVGIVYTAQKEGILDEGFLGILNFAAILSINLAIINVLPFPALDGGRALFVFLEKFMGKKFRPNYERWANYVGFILLLSLMFLVSLRDVKMVLVDTGMWARVFGK